MVLKKPHSILFKRSEKTPTKHPETEVKLLPQRAFGNLLCGLTTFRRWRKLTLLSTSYIETNSRYIKYVADEATLADKTANCPHTRRSEALLISHLSRLNRNTLVQNQHFLY